MLHHGSSIRRTQALIALSFLMILIVLLAAHWLAGVLHRPLSPEIFTTDVVVWEMERPYEYTRIEEFVINSYTSGVASIDTAVLAFQYRPKEKTTRARAHQRILI